MGDKDAYKKLLVSFYKSGEIRKRRSKLERKLREAQEELDIISAATKIEILPDEEGALYLCFSYMKCYNVYIKLGRWIEAEIVDILDGVREIKVGPVLCDLKTNLQWAWKEIRNG